MAFWPSFRARLALHGCEDAGVRRRARQYARHPHRFAARLAAAMPMIQYVAGHDEAAGVPSDFVFLPWVESHYRPVKTHGNRPAGIWQIMPRTARTWGLTVNTNYDGRLDPRDSTAAVMRMLNRYADKLRDWRLVDMAYNAGFYRIQRLRKQRGLPAARPAIPQWPVSPITRAHLTRLTALSCIVRDPQRYDVELPPPPDNDSRLVDVPLNAAIDLGVAARLAGLPLARVRALNPGYRSLRAQADGPSHLLLPQAASRRFAAAYAGLPPDHWEQWTRVRLQHALSLKSLAANDRTSAQRVSKINHLDANGTIAAGQVLLLPVAMLSALPSGTADADTGLRRYTVRPGDSLWVLAGRFHVSVSQLRRWNHLSDDTLHPGQTLRVGPIH